MIPPLHTYYLSGAAGFFFLGGGDLSKRGARGIFFPHTYDTYMTGAIRDFFSSSREQRHLSTAGLLFLVHIHSVCSSLSSSSSSSYMARSFP